MSRRLPASASDDAPGLNVSLETDIRLPGKADGSANVYAIWILSPDGRIVSCQAGLKEILSYKAKDIIGRHISSFYTSHDIENNRPESELLEARKIGQLETSGWRVHKDGSRFWANNVITAIQDEAGQFIGFSYMSWDLTERMREQEALLLRERRLRDTIASSPIGIAEVSLEGRWLECNRAICAMLGYTIDELRLLRTREITHPEDIDKDKENTKLLLSGVLIIIRWRRDIYAKTGLYYGAYYLFHWFITKKGRLSI